MKDSGADWLGAVPARWKIKAIKWATPVQRGASPRPIDDPSYFDDDGEYAWVRISDVTAAGMYLDATEQRLSDLGSSLSVKMQPGSLFLSIAGTVGKPCIANIKCCIHDGFVYFPRWKGDSRFLFYVFASGEPYKGLGKMGTQLNLNTDTVGSIVIGIPDAPEQRLIADYLDRTTAELDSMTTAVEAAIDRLVEYRQAVITSAVTGKIDVRELA
jgi:type I restriction enzyme S subunit